MAIKKTAEQNQKRRRSLAFRIVAVGLSIVIVAALSVVTFVFDVDLLPGSESSGTDGNGTDGTVGEDVAMRDLTLAPEEESDGQSVFRGDFGPGVRSLTLAVQVGGQPGSTGLVSVMFLTDNRRFEGEMTADGQVFAVRGETTELFFNVEPGLRRLLVERTNDEVAQIAVVVDHP